MDSVPGGAAVTSPNAPIALNGTERVAVRPIPAAGSGFGASESVTTTQAIANLGSSTGAQTAVAGAATLNTQAGTITTEALTGATTYTLTLTNSKIVAGSTVLVMTSDATSAVVPPTVISITPATGSVAVVFAMSALTGTFKIRFAVFN